MAVLISGRPTAIAQANPAQGIADDGRSPEFLQKLEDATGLASRRIVAAAVHVRTIPDDLSRAFDLLIPGGGYLSFFGMLGVILAILAAAFGIEYAFKRYTTRFHRQLESIPRLGEIQKFWSAILRIIADLLGLFVFALFSLADFLFVYGGTGAHPLEGRQRFHRSQAPGVPAL